jgi:hypothetical protein
MKKIIIGAPSLTGGSANEVGAEFNDLIFPIDIKFTNLVARGLTFPEVNGLALESCAHSEAGTVTVEVDSLDALNRLVSSIEQVAELNGYAELLAIEPVFDEGVDADELNNLTADESESEATDLLPVVAASRKKRGK